MSPDDRLAEIRKRSSDWEWAIQSPVVRDDCSYLLALAEELQRADDPEWDATDAAHPAWWRGCDYGCARTNSAGTGTSSLPVHCRNSASPSGGSCS